MVLAGKLWKLSEVEPNNNKFTTAIALPLLALGVFGGRGDSLWGLGEALGRG